ncbi:MAG: hypothetical protein L0Y58_12305 [Verrucomicrobia subdivision 3 bacterium]|nr:hypothetical protein [Limisphaerales bacterium]
MPAEAPTCWTHRNNRELQNVIERAILLSPGDTLQLAPDFGPAPPLEDVERRTSSHQQLAIEMRSVAT